MVFYGAMPIDIRRRKLVLFLAVFECLGSGGVEVEI